MTIISFLRPRMVSSPFSFSSPMSPVWNQPSSKARAVSSGCWKYPVRDVLAAHQDLAVRRNLHFHAGNRFADAALARVERMIQRHDGRGLGESVALDHQESKFGEERFQIRRQRRRADDEAPKFPSEQADAPCDSATSGAANGLSEA